MKYFASSVVVSLLAVTGHAQTLLDHVNFRGSERGGFGIYGATVFTGYSRSSVPIPSLGLNRSNVTYGASGSVGWQAHGENTNASIFYTGNYGGANADTSLGSYGQTIFLGLSTKLAPKWTASISASGGDNSVAQYLFQPLGLSVLSALPTTFNDLSAALGVGQFSSAQIAAVATQQGTVYLISPIRTALLGDRVRSYYGLASLNYAFSRRLSFYVSGTIAGGQNHSGSDAATPADNYALPRSLGGSAGLTWSYPLSARTDVGFGLTEGVNQNRFQTSYSTSANVFFGRKMNAHWVVHASGGATRTQYGEQLYGGARALQGIASGSLGFKFRAQTLTANYDLTASDSYGFATGTSTSATGAWNWHRPTSKLTMFSSVGRQKTSNTGFLEISGWQAGGGAAVSLSRETSLSVQYVYLDSASRFLGVGNSLNAHSVRASLSWSPRGIQR